MKTLHTAIVITAAVVSMHCARPTEVDGQAAPVPAASAAPAPPKVQAPNEAASAVRVPIEGLPVFGSSNASVTIVAFVDYECPYSAKADKTIAALRETFGDELRVAIATHPLPMHEHAGAAARAFLAAASLGKAEAMHARLFAAQSALDDANLRLSAEAIGLDGDAFDAARSSASVTRALAQAEALGASLNVTATPTFFINGRHIAGAQSLATFRAIIDKELEGAKELTSRGIAKNAIYATLMNRAPTAPAPAPQPPPISSEIAVVAVDGAPMRGSRRAPVTVVVFSDFECPYCVRVEETLRKLEAEYDGKVRVAFRHMPLPMHEHARLAAKASLAAEAQGRFWEYHDILLQHRDALDRASLETYAFQAGLDRTRFAKDIDDAALDRRVSADEAEAAKLDVKGTPTSFVNGRRIDGAQTLATFRLAVDRALAAAR